MVITLEMPHLPRHIGIHFILIRYITVMLKVTISDFVFMFWANVKLDITISIYMVIKRVKNPLLTGFTNYDLC